MSSSMGVSYLPGQQVRYTLFPIFLAGFILAMLFCFVLYPHFQTSYDVKLDPDGYGLLGYRLSKGEGLTFNPEEGPTIYRGPFYPAFIALVLFSTAGWFPGGVWLAQSILFGLTCVFIFLLARKLWNRSVALTAAYLCAAYPVLLWMIPRMWNEILSSFLLVVLIYFTVSLIKAPSKGRAVAMGVLLGCLTLTKAVYFPFVIILPLLLLWLLSRKIVTEAVLIVLTALLCIIPWTIRNYSLSGKFVPVHVGLGGNLKRGNLMSEEFLKNPFSYSYLFKITQKEMDVFLSKEEENRIQKDLNRNKLMLESALKDIRENPFLIVKKAAAAGAMFWYMGDTTRKTIILIILRVPVIFLFVLAAYKNLRLDKKLHLPIVVVIFTLWILHMPFAPNARMSIPLMAILLMYSVTCFKRPYRFFGRSSGQLSSSKKMNTI